MLKYEHISCRSNDPSAHHKSGGAYRVTTTYKTALPDIKYFYKSRWHRTDGPAVIDLEGGYILFTISGTDHVCTEVFCKAAGMSDEETFMWVLRFGDELPESIEGFYGEDWRSIPVDHF